MESNIQIRSINTDGLRATDGVNYNAYLLFGWNAETGTVTVETHHCAKGWSVVNTGGYRATCRVPSASKARIRKVLNGNKGLLADLLFGDYAEVISAQEKLRELLGA